MRKTFLAEFLPKNIIFKPVFRKAVKPLLIFLSEWADTNNFSSTSFLNLLILEEMKNTWKELRVNPGPTALSFKTTTPLAGQVIK